MISSPSSADAAHQLIDPPLRECEYFFNMPLVPRLRARHILHMYHRPAAAKNGPKYGLSANCRYHSCEVIVNRRSSLSSLPLAHIIFLS